MPKKQVASSVYRNKRKMQPTYPQNFFLAFIIKLIIQLKSFRSPAPWLMQDIATNISLYHHHQQFKSFINLNSQTILMAFPSFFLPFLSISSAFAFDLHSVQSQKQNFPCLYINI